MGETMVRIGELRTTKAGRDGLVAVGLGSCVGVVLVDRAAGVTGLAHVMLPSSEGHRSTSEGKFADRAVPALIREMEREGALRARLEAWLAGGASMFAGAGSALDIGDRNAHAVRAALGAVRVPVRGTELGGSAGRTMRADGAGRVTVKRAGGAEQVMAPGTTGAARAAEPAGARAHVPASGGART
jgi:chemotaxis protein CheD